MVERKTRNCRAGSYVTGYMMEVCVFIKQTVFFCSCIYILGTALIISRALVGIDLFFTFC